MTDSLNVWVAEDDPSVRFVLERALSRAGMTPTAFEHAAPLLERLASEKPDVVITDIRMPGIDGLSTLKKLRASHPALPVIVITAHTDLESAVAAYEGGAFEYLPKPFDVDTAIELVTRAAGARDTEAPAPDLETMPSMIGRAPAMQAVFRAIGRLARSSMTVLITGESGTGKELVARALHQHSPRATGPFIALNTAAIPSELLESELFGHERGAFTGADARRHGRFEQADGGTLFLDEIGDMSVALQTRLLRVLAEGEFYRVGGQSPVKVDVRVIAATHQDLAGAVRDGRFRDDLLHRLNVIRIEVPGLRDREEDIPNLLSHYLAEAARELDVPAKTLTDQARRALMGYAWPGNVRELINVCRRLTVLAPGQTIALADLPDEIKGSDAKPAGAWQEKLAQWARAALTAGRVPVLPDALMEFERTLINVALEQSGGRRQEAAKLLGWGRNTLTRKIKEHGLN